MDPANQNSPVPETQPVTPQPSPQAPPPITETPVIPVTPPPLDQVTVVPAAAPNSDFSDPVAKPQQKPPKMLGIIIAVVVFLLVGVFGLTYAIAAEKIAAPTEQIQKAASAAIFSIPFIPKTPGYIVDSFLTNSKPEAKSSFDLSIAASSNDFQAMLGGSNFDIRVSGYSDFSDVKNPLADVKIEISNLFDGQLKKTADKVYVKIGKIPAFVYLFMSGMTPEIVEPLFADWISSDVSTLDTDARALLNTTTPAQSPVDEASLKVFKDIFSKDVRPHLRLSQENLDGEKAYRLDFSPTPAQLDILFSHIEDETRKLVGATPSDSAMSSSKPSDTLKDVHFSAWIDTSNRLRKVTANGTIDYQAANSSGSVINSGMPTVNSAVSVAVVLKQTDFGKTIPVVAPETSITSEEFLSRISAAIMPVISASDSGYFPVMMPQNSLTY